MMPEVRWKVYFLFALITLSIFVSISLSKDTISEGIATGNGTETNILIGANTSNGSSITALIDQLAAGNHNAKLDTAARIGDSGKPAADELIERIEKNSSSSESNPEELNNYMLLALLETEDERAEKTLSAYFTAKVTSKDNKTENELEGQPQSEVSEDILQAIEAKDAIMRRNLASSLNMDYKDETDALEEALKAAEQNSTIYDSIALSEFGPEEPGSETEKLLKALKSDSGNIRIAAIMALAQRKEKAAVDPIIGILTRDYPPVQGSAAFALGEIGDEAAAEILLQQLEFGDTDSIRSNSAIALAKMGEEKAVPVLINKLRDSKAGVRSSAALALGKIGDETSVEPLIEVLNSGKVSEGERAKDSVNTNEDIRKSVVLALGEIKSSKATETLIAILTDENEKLSVRIAAASALGKIGDSESIEALKVVLENQGADANLRNEAFLSLGKTKNKEVAEILVAKMEDPEYGASAREALKDMGEMAVDPLIEKLEAGDKRVKDNTALILIEIGDPKAIEPLVEAYKL